ncbi:hypothetical protein NliqN6_5243 [Naganishia liquefaciens]|uniref:Uncharacterized protein n=1 Tax=Naganishia liquefaciens TaxID=104408 RepID=A0A8H3YIR8_9TREE|nr:hypothetical protein NliqN6_5243 [Naganishia liquefaciens]
MIIPPDKKEPVYDPANSSSASSPPTTPYSLGPEAAASRENAREQSDVGAHQRVISAASDAPRRTSRRAEEGEATEGTALLPPPSYSEAVSQNGKRRAGRRWRRLLAMGLAGMVFLICSGAFFARWRRHAKEANCEWKRGGIDGKGGFDHRWQHRSPFFFNETSPRDCDLFDEPRLIDPWRNGATARPVYETIAEHTFSLNSAESFSDLWLHVRGSKAYGGVEIVGLGTEVTEYERPPSGKVKMVIRVTTENMRNLADYHFCRAGDKGKEGIVIVGPNDGSRPVTSSWEQGYMKFVVVIVFPVEASAGASAMKPKHLLNDFSIEATNMAVDFSGDLASTPMAKTVSVGTTNALIVLTKAISADLIGLETSNANIAAQMLQASESIALHTENGHISCVECIAQTSYIVVHNNGGRIKGKYRAGASIDLVTTEQEISGKFYSPRIWIKNDGAAITGEIGGVLPESQNGSLMLLTTFCAVTADIDFAHLIAPKHGQDLGWSQSDFKSEVVPIRLGIQSSDIVTTITSLPTHVGIAIEASAIDGGLTLVAPNQLQTLLDIQSVSDGMTSVDLGDEMSRKNKFLRMNRQPMEDGRWRGPVQGSLTFRPYVPRLPIPHGKSSIRLASARYANLVL